MNVITVLIAAAAICASTGDAFAGGMLLPVRGVRTVERAGALIAGADDADSLWLDPAGLAHLAGEGRTQLLFDVAYVAQRVDYTRIDSGVNRLASVSNQQSGSPIPTVAATLGIGDRLVLAGGLAAPYAGLHRHDDDGPQRYASVSLAGSAFIYIYRSARRTGSPTSMPWPRTPRLTISRPADRSDYNMM